MKRMRFLAAAMMLLFGLTGCGAAAGGSGQKQTAEELETEPKEQEELVLWSYYETKAQKEGLDHLVDAFNDSQDRYHLTWKYVSMADYIKNLSSAVSEKDLPDLILLNNADTQSLVTNDFLEDITEELPQKVFEDEYYPEVFKTVEYGGRIYGLPFCCNNTAIIYNKDMFEQAGLQEPQTWEEFARTAQLLTEPGENGCYGFAMSAMGGEQGAFQFMPWLLSTGIDVEHMDDEHGAKAFRLLDGMIAQGSIPYDCLNWSQNDITKMFISGRAAMIENGPWAIPQLDKSGVNYGICPFPQDETKGVVLGGENLCLIRNRNTEGGMEVIRFCTQPQIMEEVGELTGNISPVIQNAERFKVYYPQYTVFVDQMAYGISRKSVPDWKKICQALSDSLYQMFGSEHATEQVWKKYVYTISGH